jgi:hypothetical protein
MPNQRVWNPFKINHFILQERPNPQKTESELTFVPVFAGLPRTGRFKEITGPGNRNHENQEA